MNSKLIIQWWWHQVCAMDQPLMLTFVNSIETGLSNSLPRRLPYKSKSEAQYRAHRSTTLMMPKIWSSRVIKSTEKEKETTIKHLKLLTSMICKWRWRRLTRIRHLQRWPMIVPSMALFCNSSSIWQVQLTTGHIVKMPRSIAINWLRRTMSSKSNSIWSREV